MQTKIIEAQNLFKTDEQKRRASGKKKAAMILAGLFIGAVNGLFGAGGGMLAVPCLTYIGSLDEKSAHATAIALILPLCLVSSIAYGVGASFENGVILPTVLGVTIGGILGACLLKNSRPTLCLFSFTRLCCLQGSK